MKKKLLNWIKRYWVIVWLVTVAVLLTVGASLAAYTSFNSVKRVVSTGKVSDTLFGSNYLSLVNKNSNEYPTRQISPSETGDTISFNVQVCNYIYGNSTSWNMNNITYEFTVKVLSRSGGNLPEGVDQISVGKGTDKAVLGSDGCTFAFPNAYTIEKAGANTHTYSITVPSNLKDQIKLEIVAAPSDPESQSATNQQKLAENIILSTLELRKDWTGHFLDAHENNPDAYDAFNYEISGNGEGTVRLEWNKNLQISPWFIKDERTGSVIVTTEGKYSVTFPVGGVDDNGNPRPNAYQLQFYKAASVSLPSSWSKEGENEGLEDWVSVYFTPTGN